MRLRLPLFILLCISLFTSCESLEKQLINDVTITATPQKPTLDKPLQLQASSAGVVVDSIVWTKDGMRIDPKAGQSTTSFTTQIDTYGQHEYGAVIYSDGIFVHKNLSVTALPETKPDVYTYEVIKTYPHDATAYTQGLEFYGDSLYESTGRPGSQRNLADVRRVNLETGKIIKATPIEFPGFGEGLTIVDDRVIQLLWLAERGIIYDLALNEIGEFYYDKSAEGWGLTHDDTYVYKSDGTSKIYRLDRKTLAEIDSFDVVSSTGLQSKVNELEMIDGKIYANRYQNDGILIINPNSGVVEGIIDMRGLKAKQSNPQADVLNGIAYRADTDQLFVTGKYWDKLFEIKLIKK